MGNVKVKSIAFNLSDYSQKKMLDHATNGLSFSAYIKNLILQDMKGQSGFSNGMTAPRSNEDAFEFMEEII